MSTTTPADRRVSSRSAQVWAVRPGLRPLEVLILSAWCGLAGGLLEVGTTILRQEPHPDELGST